MNKKELVNEILKNIGISSEDAEKKGGKKADDKKHFNLTKVETEMFFDNIIDGIKNIIMKDKIIKLAGFGTFKLRHKNARKVVNPKTKKESLIGPRVVLTFKPSKILNEEISEYSNKHGYINSMAGNKTTTTAKSDKGPTKPTPKVSPKK